MSVARARAASAADLAGETATPARFDAAWLGSRLRDTLGALRGRRLCVAYSGGVDSGALLAALAALRSRERFALRALHVDHRIQPQSAQWARAARARARRLRVPCEVIELTIGCARGESLEAAARAARYQALAARLKRGELLLTAHHQEDQLETVLLALLRGSGVRGLAAMRAVTPWAGTLLLRPLLPVSRAQLEQFVRERGLDWSEDPSNADERFDRNYLRRAVLPLIRRRWPAAATTVSRSAAHLAEARALLEQLASAGLQQARDGATLRVSVLRRLPLPQRRNALRQWIAERGLPAADQRRMREICGPMLDARDDALPRVSWRGAELRRHADRLFAFDAAESPRPVAVEQWDWRAQPWLRLADGGALGLVRDRHGDVRLAALPRLLRVRHRRGGERLQGARGRMALKDLLQAQGLAPWERAAVPLIMHAGRIIAVADLWLDRTYGCQDEPAADRGRFRWRRGGVKIDDCD
ncbi:MAG: tRNA lysidine(34) synthetase TilS [Steroidobacterales bacterium]